MPPVRGTQCHRVFWRVREISRMSRARDPHERELLGRLRRKPRDVARDGKSCAGTACPELGRIQPNENFYRRGAGLDSYCILCRCAANTMWKLSNPKEGRGATGQRRLAEEASGRCPYHSTDPMECGCELGSRRRNLAHRKKIAAAMMGNKNASGNSSNRGRTLSAEHRSRISISMRAARMKKISDTSSKGAHG